MKSTHDAIDVCSEAHQRDPRNANILRDRAEAYILNQEYGKGEELAGSSETPENRNATADDTRIRSDKIFVCLSACLRRRDNVSPVLSAVEDYKEALDFDDKQELKDGLERAQKLLKISQKRDYYKILGVSR